MLQTFTYSTGLALTGRSAACAPATATKPAAEPRRRLLTIFIVTSNLCRQGSVEGPLFPAQPAGISFRASLRIGNPGRGDLGMPPSVAVGRSSEGNRQANE